MEVRLIIDSAGIEEIREAISYGVVQGVSTNPSKIFETGRKFRDVVEEILSIWEGPLAVEGMGTEAEEMVKEARELNKLGPNMLIKIPATEEGIKAIKELVPLGVQTNATLIYSSAQALLAGLAGSFCVSPFVSRAYDACYDGIEVIAQIRAVYDAFGIKSKIIAASIHDTKQVIDAILAGADMVAVRFDVLKKMFHHAMTTEGLDKFLEDWSKMLC